MQILNKFHLFKFSEIFIILFLDIKSLRDRRVTLQELANQFSISKESALRILHETIGMSKMCLVGAETADRIPEGIQGDQSKRTFWEF